MGTRVLILALFALAACKRQSEKYCGLHPGDLENCGYLDAMIDSRPTCGVDQDCSPGAPYCEMNAHFCVECYSDTHCAANAEEKFCDLETFLCTSCRSNADCMSEICLPNGVCGDDATVAYVDPIAGIDNATCAQLTKCKTVEAALDTMKPYVKLQGTVSEEVVVSARAVTLIGEPGTTTLTRPMDGVVLTINMGSDVAIYDLYVVGKNEKGIVVDESTLRFVTSSVTECNRKDKRAIEAKMGSTLIMSRSSVYSNVGGGVVTDATTTFNISNSFFYHNGANDSMVGGLLLGAASSGLSRFEMNTVVDNRAALTADAGGIACTAAVPAPNNLIVRNLAGGLGSSPNSNKPAAGGCNLGMSLVDAAVDSFAFVSPDVTPYDYHVGPGSMAIDRGVMSDIDIDFDGGPRPFNNSFDVGADEYTP
ncbi:MAG TPA: choice-of-anchor Q domain-containing protein [Kofleriaceae bacterium]